MLAGELSRLKKAKRILEEKVDDLVGKNADLALELRGSMSSAIFNRKPPVGKNASRIRERVDDMISPLKEEIVSYE